MGRGTTRCDHFGCIFFPRYYSRPASPRKGNSFSRLKLSIDHRDCLLQTEICMSPGTTRRFHRHGFRPAANQKPVKISWGYQNSFCITNNPCGSRKALVSSRSAFVCSQNSACGFQNRALRAIEQRSSTPEHLRSSKTALVLQNITSGLWVPKQGL